MFLRQIQNKDSSFSYLVGCSVSRQALWIDPQGTLSSLKQYAQRENLNLVLLAHTTQRGAGEQVGVEEDSYRSLLQELGLDEVMDTSSAGFIPHLSGVSSGIPELTLGEHWRPDSSEGDAGGQMVQMVELGAIRVELRAHMSRLCKHNLYLLDVEGTRRRNNCPLPADALHIQVGKLDVLVWATVDAGSVNLVYQVEDRVFTGAAVRGVESDYRPTPTAVLSLPEDMIVYPGFLSDGIYVSSVRQEQTAVAEQRWALRESQNAFGYVLPRALRHFLMVQAGVRRRRQAPVIGQAK